MSDESLNAKGNDYLQSEEVGPKIEQVNIEGDINLDKVKSFEENKENNSNNLVSSRSISNENSHDKNEINQLDTDNSVNNESNNREKSYESENRPGDLTFKNETNKIETKDQELNENKESDVVSKDLNTSTNETDVQPKPITLISQDPSNINHTPESTNYSIKWIEFNKIKIPIIMQNENGPCPLIAICNVLLLRENMGLRPNLESITSVDLMHKLADTLFNIYIPRWTNLDEGKTDRLDIEKNIDDTLSKFNKLQIGLDVNVIFSGCRKFEYTSELDIFDLFGINLYHGWLIDPQQQELFENFADKSYNKLVEYLLNNETNGDDKSKGLSLLADNFLQITASQLTYYGLSELYSHIDPNELAILFRNNHFSTIYKNPNDKKLYILCTDQGYLSHPNIVWETLDNIEGDGEFCDSNFNLFIESKLGNVGIVGSVMTDNQESSCQNE